MDVRIDVPEKVSFHDMRMMILDSIDKEFNAKEWRVYLQFVLIRDGVRWYNS